MTEPASCRITEGRTTMPLRLEPNDAVFVVFRRAATATSRTLPLQAETKLGTVQGSWHVDSGGHTCPVWKNDLYLLVQWLFR